MSSLDLPPLIDAWFTQYDGQRESFLREQILSNARAMYADSGHRFGVVLGSRLRAGHGFREPLVVYSAWVVEWWWEDGVEGEEEEEESDGAGGTSDQGTGWGSSGDSEKDEGGEHGEKKSEEKKGEREEWDNEPTQEINGLLTATDMKDLALEEAEKHTEGVEGERSEDDPPLSKPAVSPDKRRKTLRRRIVGMGEVDCRDASKALDTLAKNVVRDAGDWLRAEGQEDLLLDFEVLCEKNRARKADDDGWRKQAHDAEVFNAARLPRYGDQDAY